MSPDNRSDFTIAIICALGIESDTILAAFDEIWEYTYGKAAGDPNTYTVGRIANHVVVLTFLPSIGKTSAASAAASLRSSFLSIQLCLVVGICGGVPIDQVTKCEIFLGDIIISTGMVQYDFGRQLPHRTIRKDSNEDNLPRPTPEVRSALQKLQSTCGRKRLQEKTCTFISDISRNMGSGKSKRPSALEDKLYHPAYRHKHRASAGCDTCSKCEGNEDETCDNALESSCSQLHCEDERLVRRGPRPPSEAKQMPRVHFGRVASGDMVMKSGMHRDMIAVRERVIAFEMEGAGVWEHFSTVVIKGVCDYSDSHKNKTWQPYASVTAAACTKAFLQEWITADKGASNDSADLVWCDLFHYSFETTLLTDFLGTYLTKRDKFYVVIDSTDAEWLISKFSKLMPTNDESTLTPLETNDPMFSWIFQNIDFHKWANNSHGTLWLSGPPERNIYLASSHIINQERSQSSGYDRLLLYLFCSSLTAKYPIANVCIYTMLVQLVRDLPEEMRLLVMHRFLRSHICKVLDNHPSFGSDITKTEWENDKDLIIDTMLGETNIPPWEALQEALGHTKQDLFCVFDGLNGPNVRNAEFPRDVRTFLENLPRSNIKVKALLTSRPRPVIEEILTGIPSIVFDKERQECLRTLCFDNTRYGKIPKQHSGSFEWIWQHHEYKDWMLRDDSRLLCIQGKPGSGKSTLTKYFSDTLLAMEPSTESASVARFFYSYREGELQTSHHSMLQSILFDILEQHESFFYHRFQARYRDFQETLKGKNAEDKKWPYNTLKELICSLQDYPHAVRIYLILDAVDESNEKDRRDIFTLLFGLCSNVEYCTVKIFIASRPLGQLDLRRAQVNNFITLQDETEDDISSIAYSKLKGLNIPSYLDEAMEYIVQNAQGVFIWVLLVGEELLTREEEGYCEEEIIEFLKCLPTELEDFYVLMFGKLNKDSNIRDGVRMFQLVLFGKRPVTVDELLHAVAIPCNAQIDFEPLYDVFRRRIPSERRIIHCGGNFLEIKSSNEGRTVQVIHQTVREFFMNPVGFVSRSDFQMSAQEAHKSIAITCIRYLMIFVSSTGSLSKVSNVPKWSTQDLENYAKYLNQALLANYALRFLKHHLDFCPSDTEVSHVVIQFTTGLRSNVGAYLLDKWVSFFFKDSYLNQYVGTSGVIFRNNMLIHAAWKGYLTTAEILWTAGAEVNAKDNEGRTPLSWAAQEGKVDMIQLLLQKGANPELEDKSDQTPLLWAAATGQEKAVMVLIENGAEIETRDRDERTPLQHAVERGYEPVIRLLIQKGADLQSTDSQGRTPLWWALEKGNEMVLAMLLENGVFIDSADW